jgi:hypothetical protein
MALKIPKEDFSAFVAIADLDDDSFGVLLKSFASTTPSLRRGKFTSELSASLPAHVRKEVPAILNALFALYDLKGSDSISADALSEAIAQAAQAEKALAPHLTGGKVEVFKKRLVAALSFDETLGVMVKAVDVSTEFENTFCSSRIFSDIRPVFAKNPDSVSAAVVVHNLQLGFHDGASGDHKELYVALDDDDLSALKETIDRAQKKGVAVRRFLKTSNVTYVDV